MKAYRDKRWKKFRERIFQNDGYVCCTCGKGRNDGKIIQVHHSRYIKGRKPWEYPPELCETICKGCHAERHGIIKPKSGWEYVAEEDLGDLIGECEWCGTSLRYLFCIYHENWGFLEVGTTCCDTLTESESASAYARAQKRRENRIKRFVDSNRWRFKDNVFKIKQHGYSVEIHHEADGYRLIIKGERGQKIYPRLIDAKLRAFDFIESGEAQKFFKK